MNDRETNDGAGAYKWVALALLTVGYFMQQGTRQIFNSVLPQMKLEFTSVAASDWGTVMTVFAAVYGVCVLFAGVLGDLFSRKKTILISVALFSLAILASGFARPFGWLSLVSYLVVVYSVVFAVGQCLYPSSANSILSQLHDKTRSMAMSVMQSALYVAVVAVSLASGWLAGLGQGAWRYPFWVFGGFGLALFVVLALFLRDTKPVPAAPGAVQKPSMAEAFKAFAVKPSAWLLMVAFGFQVFTNFGFTVWTPVYLRETFFADKAMAATEAGFWTMFHSVIWHYAGCVIGIMLASRFSDRLAVHLPRLHLELAEPLRRRPLPLRPRARRLRLEHVRFALRRHQAALPRLLDGLHVLRRVPRRRRRPEAHRRDDGCRHHGEELPRVPLRCLLLRRAHRACHDLPLPEEGLRAELRR